jgi:hypothetical protein
MEQVEEVVETGISSRLQPWQAIFGILTYAIGVFGISDEKALILYGLILAALGFTMVSSYKHKEAIKQVVAPWLVEQILKTLGEYLKPPEPPAPEEPSIDPLLLAAEERRQLRDDIVRLKETVDLIGKVVTSKDGTSDSG